MKSIGMEKDQETGLEEQDPDQELETSLDYSNQ